ncbi:DUF6146 family protein [Croceiramulus getboli]|nr:DUF6146 family protein [Flavobacteriaceae bacterium YJPT1-3]
MKTVFTFFSILAVLWALGSCGSTNNRSLDDTVATGDTLRIANDSLEYEIIIIEPRFNTWLVTQPPRGYYEQEFLENRNIWYVTQYNNRVLNPQGFDASLYLQRIDYEPDIDYGYEVNYLLYNWFRFFEERYNQRFSISRRGFQ